MNEANIVGDGPAWRMKSGGRKDFRLLVMVAALVLLPTQAAMAASVPAAPAPFLMGTNNEETTLVGKWYRRVYVEAFRRMEVPLAVVVVPIARLAEMASNGELHGQASRLAIYAESHPAEVRVDESIHEQRLSLFGFDPAGKAAYPRKLEDLASGKWAVEYHRGILFCEKTLKPLLPPDKLSDITTAAQGLNKIMAGRTDLYCDFSLNVEAELLKPEFKNAAGIRPVIDLGTALQLYPYVHKSRAELAPKLAETLKKMKAEGLIERYLRDSKREIEAAR